MTRALRYRVIERRNVRGSMEMPFLLHALEQGASACPDKSGHTSNADLTMIRHDGRCPDLLGPAGALLLGHGAKKTSAYSFPHGVSRENFFADLMASQW